MAYTGARALTRSDVADVLQVSPSRVSQIAKQLKLEPEWNGSEFVYSRPQLRRMMERNTKPGPRNHRKGNSK